MARRPSSPASLARPRPGRLAGPALGPVAVLALALLVLPAAAPLAAADSAADAPADAQPLLGFSADGAAAQRDLESRFDAQLDPALLKTWLEHLAAKPHHVGSPWDKANAEYIEGLYKSWGFDAHIEQFEVLFPTPKTRELEMVAPTKYTAKLEEPALAQDHTSGQKGQLPTYNAYSVDGDVTGELVYVNYGVPDDYDELARRGIDVAGKIVIARYGGSWRGIKPKVAAEHGAIGCILYSDPRGDGYFQGDPYPEGGFRPRQGVQRGSVEDMPLYPGDPLTPGVGATADAKRLPLDQAKTLTKIPVLPISWGDAQPLLAAMTGPVAPEDWRGALPLTYHLGPGPAKVHLKLAFDWSLKPIYDVIARMPGSEYPDQWVIRGNHQDAWVNGATDPISGQVAVLAEARAVGMLVKSGWHPRRTLIYAAWDGEEPGLLGSVEWVETHADELRQKAVAYINSDSNSRGFLSMGGSHTLQKLANQVARDVPDPEKGISVLDRSRDFLTLYGNAETRKTLREQKGVEIRPLGSGSDYTPFLQHLGIASMNIGYGGEDQYGQYHSIYDSIDHFERFMDPGFAYGVALAQTGGRFTLRLAQADVVPFTFGDLSTVVSKYIGELEKLADTMRDDTAERDRRLDDKVFENVADPTETWYPPKREDPVPYLNFAPLQNALATLQKSVGAYEKAYDAAGGDLSGLSDRARTELDGLLFRSERTLTLKKGLPGRPWFTHFVYAPGFYTGYGVKTLPAVREAIEQREWNQVPGDVDATAGVIDAFAAQVDRATAVIEGKEGSAGAQK